MTLNFNATEAFDLTGRSIYKMPDVSIFMAFAAGLICF